METIYSLYIKIYNDIQKWGYSNSVVNQAGGFTIGYSTYHFITALIMLISPAFILIKDNIYKIGKTFGIEKTGVVFKIIKFIFQIIIEVGKWLFTILLTFLLLEYMFNNKLLGLKSNIKNDQKKDFIISKTEVENSKSPEKIIEEVNKEKVVGKIILEEEEKKIDKLRNDKEEYQNIVSQIL